MKYRPLVYNRSLYLLLIYLVVVLTIDAQHQLVLSHQQLLDEGVYLDADGRFEVVAVVLKYIYVEVSTSRGYAGSTTGYD